MTVSLASKLGLMHVFVKRRAIRVALAAALACMVQAAARAAPDAPFTPISSLPPLDSAAAPRPPVMLAQSDSGGWGLGILAPALPMPVKPSRPVSVTAELPPCEPAEPAGPGEAGQASSTPQDTTAEHPPVEGQECALIPTAGPVATPDAIDLVLDYVPPAPGAGAPVNWGRPVGAPRPWFAGVSTQEGVVLGSRSLTYRSLEGPSVSVGSLTPFSPAWSSVAPIGGVQISNLTAGSDSTVPEGKLGYSSVWGHINNTDPAATSGGVDYGAPVGTSALRYGVLPDVTVEGQVQSARGLTATGLGTTYSMGQWGTLQGGATQGRFDTAEGWRYRLGYNVDVYDSLSLGYSNELTTSGYGDLSTYQDGAIGDRQLRNTFSAGVPISGWGTFSGTYSGLRDASGELIERRFGVSQSMLLSPNVRLAVGADRDVVSGDYAVNMQLTLPIGRR